MKYVRSEENPADVATRGVSVDDLKKDAIWWTGPKWMISDDGPTYNYKTNNEAHSPTVIDAKMNTQLYEVGLMADNRLEKRDTFAIDEAKFSEINRMVRITAWCFRFVNNARKNNVKGCLTATEIENSMCA